MKQHKFLRAIALILLVCTMLFVCASCAEEVGAGHNDRTTVLKIGDYKVTMDQYRYLCYKIRNATDGGDRTYWTTHPEAEAKFRQDVLKEIAAIYAVYSLCEEFEIELSDEEEAQLNDVMRSYIKPYGSEDAFLAAAAKNHMTGDLVRMEVELEMLKGKLYEKLTDARTNAIRSDDASVEAALAQGQFYGVRYILLQHTKTAGEADKAMNLGILQGLRDRVASGESITEVYQRAYDVAVQTPSVTYQLSQGNKNGSYFIKGYQDEIAENAVLALPIGGVSEVLEIGDYDIFYQRIALDMTYLRGSGFSNLREQYAQKQFSDLLEKRAQELLDLVKYKSAYDNAFSMTQA